MILRHHGALRLALLMLPVLLVLGMVAAIAALSADSTSGLVPPDVRERALRGARVRVMVELRLPSGRHVSEGLLSPAAIGVQRNDIADVRRGLLARLSVKNHAVLRQYDTIPLLALEINRHALAELEASGFWVTRVMPDTLNAPSLPESVPLIGADQVWSTGFDGSGVVVAILDTGVQSSHPFLAGKVVEEACYSSTVSGRSVTLCPNGLDEQLGAGAGENCPLAECWHGTHVAGIAAGNGATAGEPFSGVAKGADIMAIQVFSRFDNALDCAGSPPCVLAWTSDVIAGLERVYSLRGARSFAAANLSLGSGLFTQPCDAAEKPIIDTLRSVDIATVIAAGNNGATGALSSPACISSAISAGAVTKSDVVASFSNVSPFMSLFGPGDSIFSSVVGGNFGATSGTSMAAPHVAGAWAILKQAAPSATVDQILTALQTTGLPITDTRPGGTATRPRIRVADAVAALLPTTLSASPATIAAGGNVTATWSEIDTPTPTDWIALYAQGAADEAYRAWIYVSCSQTAGSALAAGSCPVALPSDLPPGTHELRLFANNSFTRLATSGTFTVTGAAPATLSASPATLAAGGTVTATWSGIAAPTAMDWIGVYAQGAGDGAFGAWVFVSCAQTAGSALAAGSCPVTLPIGLPPGTYELRLFANNSFIRLATSNGLNVTP